MAHKELGYKYENDWTPEAMKEVIDGFESIIVVPVEAEIKADQTVLNFDKVKKIVSNSKKFTLMDCSCRTDRKHCDAPLETCLTFDENAEKMLSSKDVQRLKPHAITQEEAMTVLKKSNEAGLLHLAYIDKDNKDGKIGTICSCCSCCCENLGAILRYGMAPHLLKGLATTTTDESKCTSCGICVDRCHFGARKIEDGSLKFDEKRCYGCGLCVTTCPTNAITLKSLE
jgi:Pyruvate/2-oxoacid:ferredoxin oxidoreductase delta subunit